MVNHEHIVNVEIVTMICTVVATVTAVVIAFHKMATPFKEEIRASLKIIYDKLNGFTREVHGTQVDLSMLKAEHELLKPTHFHDSCPNCRLLRRSVFATEQDKE